MLPSPSAPTTTRARNSREHALAVADLHAGDRAAAVAQQLLRGHPFHDHGTGVARGCQQDCVEHPPRQAEAGAAKRRAAGPGKAPDQAAPQRSGHLRAFERGTARAVERGKHAQRVQLAHGFGAHVFGTGFFARETSRDRAR